MKKRTTLFRTCAAAAVLAAAALLASCDQAPLFYDISKEIAPKEPIIEGSPSRMVLFGGREYAANGKLWAYDGSAWTKAAGPSGAVRDVAVADGKLYALTAANDPTDNRLYVSSDASSWTEIGNATGYGALQAIYGADDELLVSARKTDAEDYAAFVVSGGGLAAVPGLSGTGGNWRLVGALKTGTDYYLATVGSGIFYGNDVTAALTMAGGSNDSKYLLNGLIAMSTGQVVAAGRGGYLLAGTGPGGFTERLSSTTYKFTGALAISDGLLLAGGTTGYRELLLSGGDVPAAAALRVPGSESPTTVADGATYAGSLGKRAVNHLYKSTLTGNILFASTQQAGLWSYRKNVWNAED